MAVFALCASVTVFLSCVVFVFKRFSKYQLTISTLVIVAATVDSSFLTFAIVASAVRALKTKFERSFEAVTLLSIGRYQHPISPWQYRPCLSPYHLRHTQSRAHDQILQQRRRRRRRTRSLLLRLRLRQPSESFHETMIYHRYEKVAKNKKDGILPNHTPIHFRPF